MFRPKSSKVSVQKVLLSPFHCKPRPLGVSLESPRLENIPQVPGNRVELGQNHEARKALLATLSVLKWSGAIFRPGSSKVKVEKLLVCQFHCKPRRSGVSLESLGLQNIPHVPGNRAEVGQNHDAPEAVSATLSVLKWSGALFRPRGWKVSVQKVLLSPFHSQPRPSGVSLVFSVLENIPQVLANPFKAAQNQDARKSVSPTLLVLKWSEAIFRTRSSTLSVRSFQLCQFYLKLRQTGVS